MSKSLKERLAGGESVYVRVAPGAVRALHMSQRMKRDCPGRIWLVTQLDKSPSHGVVMTCRQCAGTMNITTEWVLDTCEVPEGFIPEVEGAR